MLRIKKLNPKIIFENSGSSTESYTMLLDVLGFFFLIPYKSILI